VPGRSAEAEAVALAQGREAAVAPVTLSAALAGVISTEGGRAFQRDWQEGCAASRSSDVGARIAALVPPGASVLGPERWWWAVRDLPYRSFDSLWVTWRLARESDRPVTLAGLLATAGSDVLIVNNDVRGSLTRYPPPLAEDFNEIVTRGARLADWTDATYGRIEVHRLAPPPTIATAHREAAP
jgi:hypothetical protein